VLSGADRTAKVSAQNRPVTRGSAARRSCLLEAWGQGVEQADAHQRALIAVVQPGLWRKL
jgi:hypothetical protein